MITITKQYRAEIAHRLPDHPGRCRFIHGHSYLFEITMTDENYQEEQDMVIDFSELKEAIKSIIDPWDHSLVLWNKDPLAPLIETFPVTRLNIVPFVPTAENMAWHIASKLHQFYKGTSLAVKSVRVWETATSFAEWRDDACAHCE